MGILIRFPRVARASQPWAERRYPVGVNPIPAAQRRRRDIFVENRAPTNPSSVRSGIFRPDGALDLFGFGFYKDFAPDGALVVAAKARDAAADVSGLEREIASQPRRVFPQVLTVAGATSGDQLVYALYLPAPRLRQAGGLTPEEIKIVEGAAK
jgi:hypothetical protein